MDSHGKRAIGASGDLDNVQGQRQLNKELGNVNIKKTTRIQTGEFDRKVVFFFSLFFTEHYRLNVADLCSVLPHDTGIENIRTRFISCSFSRLKMVGNIYHFL